MSLLTDFCRGETRRWIRSRPHSMGGTLLETSTKLCPDPTQGCASRKRLTVRMILWLSTGHIWKAQITNSLCTTCRSELPSPSSFSRSAGIQFWHWQKILLFGFHTLPFCPLFWMIDSFGIWDRTGGGDYQSTCEREEQPKYTAGSALPLATQRLLSVAVIVLSLCQSFSQPIIITCICKGIDLFLPFLRGKLQKKQRDYYGVHQNDDVTSFNNTPWYWKAKHWQRNSQRKHFLLAFGLSFAKPLWFSFKFLLFFFLFFTRPRHARASFCFSVAWNQKRENFGCLPPCKDGKWSVNKCLEFLPVWKVNSWVPCLERHELQQPESMLQKKRLEVQDRVSHPQSHSRQNKWLLVFWEFFSNKCARLVIHWKFGIPWVQSLPYTFGLCTVTIKIQNKG